MLYSAPGKESSRLTVARMASLGDAAIGLRRVLVDKDSDMDKLLPMASTTYAPIITTGPDGTKMLAIPKNLRDPRRAPSRKDTGPSSIWAGRKISELGDPQDQPGKHAAIGAPPTTQALAVPLKGEVHPYLTKEKASIVQRYVDNSAEAGAFSSEGIDANAVALTQGLTGPPQPIMPTTGRRRQPAPARRALPAPAAPAAPTATPPDVTKPTATLPATTDDANHGSAPAPTVAPPITPAREEASSPAVGRRRQVAIPASAANASKIAQADVATCQTAEAGNKTATDPFAHILDLFNHNPLSPHVPRTPSTATQASTVHASTTAQQGPSTAKTGQAGAAPELLDLLEDSPAMATDLNCSTPALVPQKAGAPSQASAGSQRPQSASDQQHEQEPRSQGPRVTQPEKPVLHRTMGQKAKNKGQKSSAKSRAERLNEILGPVQSVTAPTRQPEPETSRVKKAQQQAARSEMAARVEEFAKCVLPLLESCEAFPGALSLELQVGRILIGDMPSMVTEDGITPKAWTETFRPRHLMLQPCTSFTGLVTQSGADVDYILNLVEARGGGEKMPLFDASPLAMLEWYEIHCLTKNNETIVINVSSNGDTFVTRPKVTMASVNIHCPNRVWDAAATIKGSLEYKRGVDATVDNAISDFLDRIYVPEGDTVCIYTRMPDGSIFQVTEAYAKRQSKHRCHPLPFDIAEHQDADDEGIQLQITEVQSLLWAEFEQDRDSIRLRALPYEAMVREQRVWHEISIVSPAVSDALMSNCNVDVGEKGTWCAQALVGTNEAKASAAAAADRPTHAAATTGAGAVTDMFRVAVGLVDRIDPVGQLTDGIGPYMVEEQLQASGPALPTLSQVSASASVNPALRLMASMRISNTHGTNTVQADDSVSVMGGPVVTEEDFW
ncbi:hypothetical protein KEM52_006418 [Ascosphaera acerosa]|nr:hypothetical protein KEM52_006418 [Ascosphaera acerosa]